MIDIDRPVVHRAAAVGAVVALHIIILGFLGTNSVLRRSFSPPPLRLVLEARRPPPEPPRMSAPKLTLPPVFIPVPEIEVAAPVVPSPLRMVTRTPSAVRPSGHFAAATDLGLGLDVGTTGVGGTADRGNLAGFEAAVRQHVMAGKQQPVLAWDRRNTCIVGYTVKIGIGGKLSGFSIDPCAVPELNNAARIAIQRAIYPRPPQLGAQEYEVHGSLIFRP